MAKEFAIEEIQAMHPEVKEQAGKEYTLEEIQALHPDLAQEESISETLLGSTLATGQGLLQGASAGLYNPISAAIQAPIRAYQMGGLSGVASLEGLSKGYEQARQEQELLANKYQGASTASELVAGLNPYGLGEKAASYGLRAANIGEKVAKGVSGVASKIPEVIAPKVASPFLKGAAESAGTSAILSAPQQIENLGNDANNEDFYQNLGISALTGGTLNKVMSNLGNSKKIEKMAENMATKAGGAEGKKYQNELNKTLAGKSAGKIMLEKDLVRAGDGLEDTHARVSEQLSQTGKELGDSYKGVQSLLKNAENKAKSAKSLWIDGKWVDSSEILRDIEAGKINTKKITENIIENAKSKLKNPAGKLDKDAQQILDNIDESLKDFKKTKNMDVNKLHEWRIEIDNKIKKWDAGNKNAQGKVVDGKLDLALKEIRNDLNNRIDDVFENAAIVGKKLGIDSKSSEQLRQLNKEYSALSTMKRIGEDRIKQLDANVNLSLTDKIALGAGMARGGVSGAITGVAGLVANKANSKYGNAALAQGLYKIKDLPKEESKQIMARGLNILNQPKEKE